jgi:peptidoglycan hydrolase CwlO-like protein
MAMPGPDSAFGTDGDLGASPDVRELRRVLEELTELQQGYSDQLAKLMAVIADLAGAQAEALALLRDVEQDLERLTPQGTQASERAALRAEAQQARHQARSLRAERAADASPPG